MSLLYDSDLADRMIDMDADLLHLLTSEITSFARWDVLRFFLETGSEKGTMDEISLAIGRHPELLLSIMGELTSLGWLARRTDENKTHYFLTQEQERRQLLDRLYASMYDLSFRLKAIYHWTQAVYD